MAKKIMALLALAGIMAAGVFSYLWIKEAMTGASTASPVVFEVKEGQGLNDIASGLKREGLIKNELLFEAYVFAKGLSGSLQAGDYSLAASMGFSDILQKLRVGDTIKVRVTVFEGFNLKQVEQSLNSEFKNALDCGDDCLKKITLSDYRAADFAKDYAFLNGVPENASLEGFLYPDTYKFKLEDDNGSVAKKMLANFNARLSGDLAEEINRQGRSVYEVVTMASLIEKEVRSVSDKRKVAGVIENRLKLGMPLQIDATLAYITGKTRFSVADTKIDSPFNTYVYKGLPKGPICNPGLESIMAAIYPEKNEYLFYLSAADGHTVFSRTFQQHVVAKNIYLK